MIYPHLVVLAQAAAGGAAPAPGGLFATPIIPFLCIGVIFYLLMIRPQQKKQKEHQSLVSSLKTGDKVVACGGIHGMIANVKDNTIILKVADNVKMEVDKASISLVAKRTEADAEPS